MIFYYGGSARPERVEEMVRSCFQPLLEGRDMVLSCQVVDEPAHPVRYVTDRLDVTQGKLAMGFRTGGIVLGHELYPALLVCNALFGGTAHSKLFEHVREQLSLCYFVSSMLDTLKGLMAVSSGVEFADFGRAEEAILEQLEEIRRGQFTREELHAAVQAVVNSLTSRKDSQGQMEDDCVTQLIARGTVTDWRQTVSGVERVTARDIIQVARMLELDTVYRLTGKDGQ